MKAITKILAVSIAAVGVTFAAGCSGGAANARVSTSANWNVRTSVSVESNFMDNWLKNKEVSTYSISLTDEANSSYCVKYNEGTLISEFYMDEFDWATREMPEAYRPAESKKELVYVYKTNATMTGEYTLTKSGDKLAFEDKTVSECYFRLAGANLQPLYSKQTIVSTAPNVLSATTIEGACIKIDGVYETFYNFDCSRATIKHTDNRITGNDKLTETEVSAVDKQVHSTFDNSQLWVAVRSMNISGGASHSFNVLSPQNESMQLVYANCTAPVVLDKEKEDQAQIINALKDCKGYIFFDDTTAEGEEERNFRFNAVSVGISVDNPMTGSAPTYWYSTVENGDVNYSKSVLLKMTTPLPFGLGTVNYTLKSLELIAK